MRSLQLTVAALALLLATRADAQYRGVRFEITTVGDTSFVFTTGTERWVHAGRGGIVLDPRRRDALVARFRVVSVHDDQVTAVVTGQTTNVRTEHVAVMEEPRRPWFRSGTFWGGAALGAALGAAVGFSH